MKLASRGVGLQASSRDSANETCPCRSDAMHRGRSKPPPRRRRDARRREYFGSTTTPSSRLNRPRRPNAIDATCSSCRHRGAQYLQWAWALRQGGRVVKRTSSSKWGPRAAGAPTTSQPVAAPPRGSLGRTRLDAVRISRCHWTCLITNRGVRLELNWYPGRVLHRTFCADIGPLGRESAAVLGALHSSSRRDLRRAAPQTYLALSLRQKSRPK